jgi:hypothetical protein
MMSRFYDDFAETYFSFCKLIQNLTAPLRQRHKNKLDETTGTCLPRFQSTFRTVSQIC